MVQFNATSSTCFKTEIEAIYQIKSNHSLFSKQFNKEIFRDPLGSAHAVLQGKYPDGSELVTSSYRSNPKVIFYFIITKNGKSEKKGNSCEIKFTNSHRNAHVKLINRLSFASDSFKVSNCADQYN